MASFGQLIDLGLTRLACGARRGLTQHSLSRFHLDGDPPGYRTSTQSSDRLDAAEAVALPDLQLL